MAKVGSSCKGMSKKGAMIGKKKPVVAVVISVGKKPKSSKKK